MRNSIAPPVYVYELADLYCMPYIIIMEYIQF